MAWDPNYKRWKAAQSGTPQGASELKAMLERTAVLKPVDDEPELPDDMPDEMWEAIAGDRDAMAEAMRIAVRQTKDGIRKRIVAL